MKRKFNIVLFCVIVFLSASMEVYASTTNERLSGLNRYGTATAVAEAGWTKADYAVLANGENFPDALSAAPLANKYNAPILLTQTDSLPSETLKAIDQLKVKNIFLIGGTGAISSVVESQLNSLGISTTRVFGQDRYETAVRVAEKLDNVSEIAIVTGEDFADALSIAPIAVKRNMPIILIKKDEIPSVVTSYINSHNITKTYIIGAGNSIDNSSIVGLTNFEKISGKDNYERNLAIIDRFKSDLDFNAIYVASGENFPDGLTGSVLAGKNSNPLLLIGSDISSQKDYFENNKIAQCNFKILGGVDVIREANVNNILTSKVTEPESTIFFPKLSDVPMAEGSSFYKISLDNGGKDILYYYPMSLVRSNFLVSYFDLLKTNGWKLTGSIPDLNGKQVTTYTKGNNSISIGYDGYDVYVKGNIH